MARKYRRKCEDGTYAHRWEVGDIIESDVKGEDYGSSTGWKRVNHRHAICQRCGLETSKMKEREYSSRYGSSQA